MYRLGTRRKPGLIPARREAGLSAPDSIDDGQLTLTLEDLVRVEPTTDPLTGLSSLSMLVLRLDDAYRYCHERNVRPGDAFALLVLDAHMVDKAPLVRDAMRVIMADEVQRSFSAEETQAAVGTRIIVLAAHTSGLRRVGVSLVRRLKRDPILVDTAIESWIQPLPDEPGELTRFVLSLGFSRPSE